MLKSERVTISFILLVTCLGSACSTTPPPGPKSGDARLQERRQRSVTDDPAVMGTAPTSWLNPPATAAGIDAPSADAEDEKAEFNDRFANSRSPGAFETVLLPGATSTAAIDVAQPARITASAQWIGTAAALPFTLTVNQAPTGTVEPFAVPPTWGGATIHTTSSVHGPAVLSLKNTAQVPVKVRFLFLATSL